MIPGIQGIHPIIGTTAANISTPDIPFVGVGTITTDVSAGTISPTYPAGINANDIGILTVLVTDSVSSPGGQTVTTPAGWTLIRAIPQSLIPALVTCYGAIYWKRLTGSESGAVVVTLSETTNTYPACSAITAHRGCVATGTPVEGDAHATQATSTTQTASAVTTTGPNRLVLSHFVSVNTTTNHNGSPNGSAVELYEQAGVQPAGHASFAGYSASAPSAGVQTAISRTVTTSSGNLSVSVALIPA